MTSPIIEDLKALAARWEGRLFSEKLMSFPKELRVIIEKHEASAEGAKVDDVAQAEFEKLCPYYGNPDPHAVWHAAFVAALRHQQAAQVAALPEGWDVKLGTGNSTDDDSEPIWLIGDGSAERIVRYGRFQQPHVYAFLKAMLAASPEPPSP